MCCLIKCVTSKELRTTQKQKSLKTIAELRELAKQVKTIPKNNENKKLGRDEGNVDAPDVGAECILFGGR